MSMIRTFCALLVFLTLLGCFGFFTSQQMEAAAPDTPKSKWARMAYDVRKARYRAFISQLNRAGGLEPTDELYQEATLFLPDTTLRADTYLFGKKLASRDSIDIIFYELTSMEGDDTWFNIASFLPDGQVVDLIQVVGKTQDANLHISIVDEAIIELEYVDFYLSPEYFKTERYEAVPDSILELYKNRHTAMHDYIWKKDYAETSRYENYRLNGQGVFIRLDEKILTNFSRRYPFASTRILANDELDRFSPRELSLMKNEIYADYGQIFTDEKTKRYFSKKSWYTPLMEDVTELLSDVEAINIGKIEKRLLVAER